MAGVWHFLHPAITNLYKNGPAAENQHMDPDQETIDDEVRDGIEKELQRTDLSPEDRAQYEEALERLRRGRDTTA